MFRHSTRHSAGRVNKYDRMPLSNINTNSRNNLSDIQLEVRRLSMKASTWLITGCARGIGRGLVKEVLQRPQTTVFAGVRDTQAQAAIDLQNLKTGEGSQLVLVKLDATKHADSQSAASTIKSHGVDHLDVVVANAGIVTPLQPTVDMPESDFLNTFQANTLGPIFLFQAVEPLLSAAANPRFFVTSSILGSSGFADKIPLPTSPYGISKAGINFFLRKMHGEFPKITFVPLHPG